MSVAPQTDWGRELLGSCCHRGLNYDYLTWMEITRCHHITTGRRFAVYNLKTNEPSQKCKKNREPWWFAIWRSTLHIPWMGSICFCVPFSSVSFGDLWCNMPQCGTLHTVWMPSCHTIRIRLPRQGPWSREISFSSPHRWLTTDRNQRTTYCSTRNGVYELVQYIHLRKIDTVNNLEWISRGGTINVCQSLSKENFEEGEYTCLRRLMRGLFLTLRILA
jgi:hypothetical protein